ncbi:MAG TPA: hypothetical protein VJB87_00640 [Candidatus Nanoarchaeia archaeon]|nr:hypothetical protein [Candidatus Nanoarchaeia archaeon]
MKTKKKPQKFRHLCTKCKIFYLPDETKISRQGLCEKCRIQKGKCKLITEAGYQCRNDIEVAGYCKEHFMGLSVKELKKRAKEL